MARFYRCRQCGTLQGTVGTFSSEPADCEECGHGEFEIVGPEAQGFFGRVVGNLSVARAIRLMTGLAAVSFILTILLPLVGVGQALFGFAVANLVVLVALAYGLTRHSAVVLWVATLAFGLATLGGVVVLVALVTEFALGGSVVEPVTEAVTTSQSSLYVVFSVIYLAIFANLVGGREDYYADMS